MNEYFHSHGFILYNQKFRENHLFTSLLTEQGFIKAFNFGKQHKNTPPLFSYGLGSFEKDPLKNQIRLREFNPSSYLDQSNIDSLFIASLWSEIILKNFSEKNIYPLFKECMILLSKHSQKKRRLLNTLFPFLFLKINHFPINLYQCTNCFTDLNQFSSIYYENNAFFLCPKCAQYKKYYINIDILKILQHINHYELHSLNNLYLSYDQIKNLENFIFKILQSMIELKLKTYQIMKNMKEFQ